MKILQLARTAVYLVLAGAGMLAPSLAAAHAPDTPRNSATAMFTLDLMLAGRPTQADVFPAKGPMRGAVILSHGFMRKRWTFLDHAKALAGEGVLAVVPDLPYKMDSRDNARALRELVAKLREGAVFRPVERIVLVGFSAGGLSTLLAADSPGVVGYIGLDPFDRPGGVGLEAARVLKTPVVLLRAPPSPCNAFSIAEPWVKALPNLVEDRVIDGANHCDFESPTDWVCRMICGEQDPERHRAVREGLIKAVLHWLP